MSGNYWLFFEKSNKKHLFRSVEGDLENTGKTYSCETSVPNSRNLTVGDNIVLRLDDEILGVGTIKSISEEMLQKALMQSDKPEKTIERVPSYIVTFGDFAQLMPAPSVKKVKACATSSNGEKSRLSIIRLDGKKICTLLEATSLVLSVSDESRMEGTRLSYEGRKTVELHAMGIAKRLYKKDGWNVVDTSNSRPYDLHVSKDGEERYVEVKGTTGGAESIILTRNEVDHVRKHPNESALVVVSEIKLDPSGEKWIASGGKVSTHETRWAIDESQLEATQYKYRIG